MNKYWALKNYRLHQSQLGQPAERTEDFTLSEMIDTIYIVSNGTDSVKLFYNLDWPG